MADEPLILSDPLSILITVPLGTLLNEFLVAEKQLLPTCISPPRAHTGLTKMSSIRFLLFEIKRDLFYNLTIFYLTDFLNLFFFIQNV